MNCPRCGTEQPEANECAYCGIIIAKFRQAAAKPVVAAPTPVTAPVAAPASPRAAAPPPAAAEIKVAKGPDYPLSAADRATVNLQLARLAKSGVPMPEAFELVGDILGGKAVAAARCGAACLRAGAGLPAAAAESGLFDAVDLALLAAAERTGTVPDVAEQNAHRHQFRSELGAQLRSSFAYPLFVVASACVLTPLPLAFSQSPVVFALNAAFNLGLLAAGLAGLWFGAKWLAHPQRAGTWLAWMARIPVVRLTADARRLSLFFDVADRCTRAAIALPEAVALAAQATAEPQMVAVAGAVAERLQHGTLSEAMAAVPGLNQRQLATLAAGERSGHLPETFAEIAASSRERLHRHLRAWTSAAKFGLSMAVAVVVAIQIIGQFKAAMSDPLAMIPGQEGQDLRQELDRAMPELRHLKP